MAAAILVYGLLAIWFGDLIPRGNGLGDDGREYAEIVRGFPASVAPGVLDRYRVGRVLPSIMVHCGLRAAGLSTSDDANIIAGFRGLNLALLVGCAYLWHGVAQMLGIGVRGRWLGFVAMFCNFGVARMAFYYPVLTDTAALACSLWLYWAHVTRCHWLVLLGGVAGGLTWPILPHLATVLLLFPYRAGISSVGGSSPVTPTLFPYGAGIWASACTRLSTLVAAGPC